jgi:phage repressor protein C with HTH and peptisase S24 domain/lambda repressor-like predicted transcriptional regulator
LRYRSRDVSGKFTGYVSSADAGIIPHVDAQQPRRNILAAQIQVRLDRLGFTARAASIKAGLKPDAIRNIVRGKSQNPRGDTLRSLARALECSVQYLVSGDDFTEDTPSDDYLPPNLPTLTMSPPGYAPVPYIAVRAAAGGGRYIEEEVLGPPKYFEEALLRELRAQPRDLRAIEVEGQSMEPLLQNGDQVLVDTRKISFVEPGLFVLFDGDGIVCKWVERAHDSAPRKLRLKSENPRFDSYDVVAERAQIIGRVVWFARRL